MKLSTFLLIVLSVAAGAWLLSVIFHLSAWLSSLLTYIIAGAIIVGLFWLYLKYRQHEKAKKDDKPSEKE